MSCRRIHDLIVGTAAFGPRPMRREGNIRSDKLDPYRILLNRQDHFDCDADGRQISLAPGEGAQPAIDSAMLRRARRHVEAHAAAGSPARGESFGDWLESLHP